ncbi:MAG: hypothetical protein B7Y25_06490 [Alphaproteobacteria bacterium 16-39-46]|nr:MAG: hypothetical protein B7Y25_06490 [Alphaproteobacteria bacterium 16-39-46]
MIYLPKRLFIETILTLSLKKGVFLFLTLFLCEISPFQTQGTVEVLRAPKRDPKEEHALPVVDTSASHALSQFEKGQDPKKNPLNHAEKEASFKSFPSSAIAQKSISASPSQEEALALSTNKDIPHDVQNVTIAKTELEVANTALNKAQGGVAKQHAAVESLQAKVQASEQKLSADQSSLLRTQEQIRLLQSEAASISTQEKDTKSLISDKEKLAPLVEHLEEIESEVSSDTQNISRLKQSLSASKAIEDAAQKSTLDLQTSLSENKAAIAVAQKLLLGTAATLNVVKSLAASLSFQATETQKEIEAEAAIHNTTGQNISLLETALAENRASLKAFENDDTSNPQSLQLIQQIGSDTASLTALKSFFSASTVRLQQNLETQSYFSDLSNAITRLQDPVEASFIQAKKEFSDLSADTISSQNRTTFDLVASTVNLGTTLLQKIQALPKTFLKQAQSALQSLQGEQHPDTAKEYQVLYDQSLVDSLDHMPSISFSDFVQKLQTYDLDQEKSSGPQYNSLLQDLKTTQNRDNAEISSDFGYIRQDNGYLGWVVGWIATQRTKPWWQTYYQTISQNHQWIKDYSTSIQTAQESLTSLTTATQPLRADIQQDSSILRSEQSSLISTGSLSQTTLSDQSELGALDHLVERLPNSSPAQILSAQEQAQKDAEDVAQISEKLNPLEEALPALQNSLKSQTGAVSSLDAAISETFSDLTKAGLSNASQMISSVQQNQNTTAQNLQDVNSHVQTLSQGLDATRGDISALQSRTQAQDAQIAAQQTVTSHVQTLSQGLDATRRDITAQQTVNSQVQTLSQGLDATRGDISALQSRTQAQDAQTAAQLGTINSLNAHLQTLSNELNDTKANLTTLQTNVNSQDAVIKEQKDTQTTLKQQLASANAQLQDLQTKEKHQEEKVQAAETALKSREATSTAIIQDQISRYQDLLQTAAALRDQWLATGSSLAATQYNTLIQNLQQTHDTLEPYGYSSLTVVPDLIDIAPPEDISDDTSGEALQDDEDAAQSDTRGDEHDLAELLKSQSTQSGLLVSPGLLPTGDQVVTGDQT